MMGFKQNVRRAAIVALLAPVCLAQQAVEELAVEELAVEGEHRRSQEMEAACERWLASDHTDEALVGKAVDLLLGGFKPAELKPGNSKIGLAWLGKRLPAAQAAPNKPRSKGFITLCTKTTLEFLRRTQKSGVVFVGQYSPLEALQPFASDFLFDLLLDTPDWYPFTFRVRLVAPIRDLQQRLPSVGRVDAISALAEDERESLGLRWGLAAMLHQWGNKSHANAIVSGLVAATAEGDAEDRVQATLQLADYYNLLRQYKSAARAHRSAQALAKSANVTLLPIAWYAAACVHSLLGETERGLQALERCVQMHESPNLDKSLRLERKLFEHDPEIVALRKEARFADLLQRAFGSKPVMKDKPVDGNKKKDGR